MKKWSRLTALVLAFVIMFSNVSGALALVEVDYDNLLQWIQNVKDYHGLGDVIKLIRGGEVRFDSGTFVPSDWPLYTEEGRVELAFAEGEKDVVLKAYGKVDLVAPSAGQWQVLIADTWVNVKGETGSTFALTFAKVQSVFEANGFAKIRCVAGDSVTQTAVVALDYSDSVIAMPAMAEDDGMAYSVSAASADAVMPVADETATNYTVTVNYRMAHDNSIAADSWIATVGVGTAEKPSTIAQTITLPVVKGYEPVLSQSTAQIDGVKLITENNVPKLKLDLTVTSSMELLVYYQPALVPYKVEHYWQNVNDDNYTLYEVVDGTDYTNETIGEVAKTYPGFYALLYDHPTVAADGSTVVEIHYDRNYYLMNFDLVHDNAYGTEPIYARYGADITGIPAPKCAGYTFKGWSLDGTNVVAIPGNMPAENRTYIAVWEVGESAQVTVVFWGENADDTDYSYITSAQVSLETGSTFTYSESGALICSLEVHTHSSNCGYNCGKTAHTHTIDDGCYELTCDLPIHSHDDSCYDSCTIESHNHTTACYANVGAQQNNRPDGAPRRPTEGYVYGNRNKYIYINGSWYRYTGTTSSGNTAPTTCGKTEQEHTHTDACLDCGLTAHVHDSDDCYTLTCTTETHSHTDACGYACGKTQHTHNSNCYMSGAGLDTNLWTFEKSDTVTVAPDGSTVVNVYYTRTKFTLTFRDNNQTVYTITEKWGADISEHWPIKGTNGTTYDNGERWDPSGSNTYSEVLVYLAVMPAESFRLDVSRVDYDTFIMHYMVEALPGATDTVSYGGKYFKQAFEVSANYNYVTEDEDFFDLEGFDQWRSNPAFSGGSLDINGGGDVYFYYTRKSYDLIFNNGYQDVATNSVLYQEPLGDFEDYVPDPPVDSSGNPIYEPGSVEFDGWYLNPECSGDEYILSEHTMPSENLLLYAKWKPVPHTVEFYLDAEQLAANNKLREDAIVNHGEKVTPTPTDPEKQPYKFIGWFYRDDEGAERAFDFETMAITRDLQVYGKWSSDILIPYTIYFKLKGEDTDVAAPVDGSLRAGDSRTFYAKGGTQLYEDYQEGYFPHTVSHTITAVITEGDEQPEIVFVFEYERRTAVPYTVRYLLADETGKNPAVDESGNYIEKAPTKVVSNNVKAIVTENFVPVVGFMPDAFQKELILSTETGAVNEIIFLYVEDLEHGLYQESHYVEPVAEGIPSSEWDERTEYSRQVTGDIDETYEIEPVEIPGFELDRSVEGTKESGQLTSTEVLHLKLYYKRLSYPYKVLYLEEGTGKELHTPKDGTGRYEERVTETAIDIANYELVSAENQSIDIRIEDPANVAKNNVIIFEYKEKLTTFNYVGIGPDNELMEPGHPAGYVTFSSETLGVVTGEVNGSTAVLQNAPTYKFRGWFLDETCTKPVDPALVDADNKLTPVKTDGIWVGTTFYAKFDWNVADLTIRKTGLTSDGSINRADSAIFKVEGYTADSDEKQTWYVSLANGEEAVIKNLKITTEYTITEMNSWTAYYKDMAVCTGTMVAGGKTEEFENKPVTDKWLHDESYEVNFDED